MQVQNSRPEGPSTGQASRVGAAPEPRHGQTERAGSAADRIELSSLASRLSHAEGTRAAERGHRIGRLAEVYRAGQYRADPQAISRSLVQEAVSAGSSGGQGVA